MAEDKGLQAMNVTLDATEVAVAQGLATMRYTVARMAKVKNQRVGSQSDYITDLEGMAGELAFCKLRNLFPDLTIGPRKGGWDVLSPGGEGIDVKVTHREVGRLLATLKKRLEDADYYVLMIGKCPDYRFAGYATAEALLREENIMNLPHGRCYALDQDKLKGLGQREHCS